MGLLVCPDCGSSVSDQAANCPRCGRPMQSNRYGGTDRTAVGVARGIFATFALLGAAASTLWGLLANTDPATAQLGKMALLIAGILWAYLIYLAIASRKKY